MKLRYLIPIFLFACTPSKVEMNTDRDKLMSIVIDLYYAEAAIKDLIPTLKDSLSAIYRQQIADIHSVDLSKVEEDLVILQSDSKSYQKFHQEVEDSIVLMLKEIEKNKIGNVKIDKPNKSGKDKKKVTSKKQK